MTFNPIYQDVARYIELLTGSGESVVWFHTHDDKKRDKGLGSEGWGTLNECWGKLCNLNRAGAGVFIAINQIQGNKRKDNNIHTSGRVACIDCDKNLAFNDFRPVVPCNFAVFRNPTHWHAYWLIDPMPIQFWQYGQDKLASVYGTDGRVNLRTQIMRVPGFYHNKNEPELYRLLEYAKV